MRGLGEIALIYGYEAARAVAALGRADPEFAQQLIVAALDPAVVLEKKKCDISAWLANNYDLTGKQYQKARKHFGL